MTCWPAGFGWTVLPSPEPSGRYARCWLQRGCTVSSGVSLRTLAEVVEYLGSTATTGILDGTEIRVRRPKVGSTNCDAFISGKSRQNAVKAMVSTDADGRMLWCSPAVPGSCADITHARRDTADPQVQEERPDWYEPIYQQQCEAHSSRRIRVAHGIAHLKNWRSLPRPLGRREHMSSVVQAVAGLLSLQQAINLIPVHM